MSPRRLSVVQQVHHQEAPTGGGPRVVSTPATHTHTGAHYQVFFPLAKGTHTHTHAHTHAPTHAPTHPHTHTHTHTNTRTNAHTNARTHTHTRTHPPTHPTTHAPTHTRTHAHTHDVKSTQTVRPLQAKRSTGHSSAHQAVHVTIDMGD